MKLVLRVLVLSLLTCSSAFAEGLEAGVVMICDTQKQIERVIQLFTDDAQVAASAVNTEENDPQACAVVDVAYVRGPQIEIVRNESRAFLIVAIAVVAINTPAGYQRVPSSVSYSLAKVKDVPV